VNSGAAPGAAAGKHRLAVCIPTLRRPHMLADCLAAVAGLDAPAGAAVHVIVADNDAAGTARQQVKQLQAAFPWPLHYTLEPERGLAAVRNRLLDTAVELDADWIAFLDDDEMPAPDWLCALWRSAQEYGADVVTGPLVPVHGVEETADARGGRQQAAGTVPRHVACNNVLFRAALAVDQGLRFDRFYDFIGGEDFDFFNRSRAAGNPHVWAADAVVFERVPPERRTLRYLCYRHFTGAINNVLRGRRDRGNLAAWCRFLPKLTGKLLAAPVYAVLALITWNGETGRKALKQLSSGLGYGAGLCNIVVERYRDIDGN